MVCLMIRLPPSPTTPMQQKDSGGGKNNPRHFSAAQVQHGHSLAVSALQSFVVLFFTTPAQIPFSEAEKASWRYLSQWSVHGGRNSVLFSASWPVPWTSPLHWGTIIMLFRCFPPTLPGTGLDGKFCDRRAQRMVKFWMQKPYELIKHVQAH